MLVQVIRFFKSKQIEDTKFNMIRSLFRTQSCSNVVRAVSYNFVPRFVGQVRFVSGLKKEMHVSAQLATILGQSTASRANITKGL